MCTVLGIATTNAFYASRYSFASETEYSGIKAKDFASILSHQLTQYPFPRAESFGKSVVQPGKEPPQWFEMIYRRFNPNAAPMQNVEALADISNAVTPPTTIGNTRLKPGWLCGRLEAVCVPTGAPSLPVDMRECHKQTKVMCGYDEHNKRNRPPQCKMCKFHGLKQKKPPYLCADCGDFFCHDVELSTNSTFPRQCYWAHMCVSYSNSGQATAVWKSEFDVWNDKRVSRCKESDGM